jgi:hypothetical protein
MANFSGVKDGSGASRFQEPSPGTKVLYAVDQKPVPKPVVGFNLVLLGPVGGVRG